MPAKIVKVDGIGTVKLYKRSGTKGIRLTVGSDHTIRVTMPPWLPYQTALEFVQSKKDWVASVAKPKHIFRQNEAIGKAHTVHYIETAGSQTSLRVANNQIRVLYSPQTPLEELQALASKGATRALRKEASNLLPQRVEVLAAKHGFKYQKLSVKQMRSRWGSCSQQKNISLNIFLLQLPWQLIDYVIVHELAHTKVLNHGQDFWEEMRRCLPNVAELRKEIRQHKPTF